jgi:hypothetical protein
MTYGTKETIPLHRGSGSEKEEQEEPQPPTWNEHYPHAANVPTGQSIEAAKLSYGRSRERERERESTLLDGLLYDCGSEKRL